MERLRCYMDSVPKHFELYMISETSEAPVQGILSKMNYVILQFKRCTPSNTNVEL